MLIYYRKFLIKNDIVLEDKQYVYFSYFIQTIVSITKKEIYRGIEENIPIFILQSKYFSSLILFLLLITYLNISN